MSEYQIKYFSYDDAVKALNDLVAEVAARVGRISLRNPPDEKNVTFLKIFPIFSDG
jgi:hypothetical protein